MNWLLCVCVLVVLVFALLGWHEGFIKTVFRLLSLALALALAAMISPVIADHFLEKEDFVENVTEGLVETLNLEAWEERTEISDEAIDDMKLPDAIKEQLYEFNDSEGFAKLAADTAADYVAKVVASIVIRAVCFVIVFAIAFIILFLVSNALNLVVRVPGLSFINKVGGMAIGLVQALIIILVAFALITAASNTGWGQSCMECITESKILTTLYDNNIINGAFVDLSSRMR